MNTTHIIHPKHRPFEPKSRGGMFTLGKKLHARKGKKSPRKQGDVRPIYAPKCLHRGRGKIGVVI